MMTDDKKIKLMVVGAHAFDAEIMAGGVVAKYTSMGHEATMVHMTLGEKGHRTLKPEEYAQQKKEEALACAEALGAKAIFLPYKDAELPLNEEVKYQLCDIIRAEKPDIIITHWKGSVHKDHEYTHYIVMDAIFYAALPTIERELPAHGIRSIYYAENWEDMEGFDLDTYIDFSDVYDKWIDALSHYELFRGGASSFRYADYYKALSILRGCRSNFQHAECFMRPKGAKVDRLPRFKGF